MNENSLSDNVMNGFLACANRLADKAGAMLRAQRADPNSLAGFESKDDLSPVTAFDRAVESAIRSLIADAFPKHGILGEEFPPTQLDAEFVWAIDPIDGTKQFIVGVPVYGTLISLTQAGRPILGIIDHPITQERWIGAKGRRSTANGTVIAARRCAQLADALMSCSNTESIPPQHRAGFERVRSATKWRIYGASCYAYASLASGRLDICADSGGHREVDYCAIVPVVEGAGGVMSDWEGRPLTINSGSSLVAAGDPRVHAEVLRLLQAG